MRTLPQPIENGAMFRSPKAATAIPIRHPLAHDVLRQASLHPAITEITYVREILIGETACQLEAILLARGPVRHIVEIEGSEPLRDIDDEGLRLIAISQIGAVPRRIGPDYILRQPVCRNARMIWHYREHRVEPSARAEILEAIGSGSLAVGRFAACFTADLFALACQAVIDIDLTRRDISEAPVGISSWAPEPRHPVGI